MCGLLFLCTAYAQRLLIERNDKSDAVALKDSHPALARDATASGLAAQEAVPPAKPAAPKAPPLTAEQQKLLDAGKATYEATCVACHQPHGLGQEALAPPLVGSEWVSGSDQRLVRIVLHGLRGPIKVKGQEYEMEMAALGILDDDQIAGVLTYVRREWGHSYPPVESATVKKIREETVKREDAWTAEELLKLP